MRPDFAVIGERQVKGRVVLNVDTSKAKYQGRLWQEMGDFGKRKFDNLLFLMRMGPERLHIKINYV